MVSRKRLSILRSSILLASALTLFLLNGIVAAQEGIEYCKERYNTDDINECIYILHRQNIYFVDPISGRSTGSCFSANSLSAALSLTYPGYDDEADVARRFEEFIREKKPTSPWLTVPDIGKRIVDEGKQYNANPFIMITIGKTESAFSTTGRAATQQNNPFGIKETGTTYVTFPTVEAGLFNDKGILEGLQNRLDNHPNYQEVSNMYEYFSVHNTGQILYPGDNVRILDPAMNVYVSSEGDTGYGPVEYWRNAMNDYNEIFGTDLPTTPPERNMALGGSGETCGEGSYPPGAGGWDLPGEGSNPLAYFSQLYGCDETPPTSPEDRSFAKTCDEAVESNTFGSYTYGSGTIERCGCGPTSAATVITTLTGNRTTPEQVAVWAQENGGVQADGCGSNWFWEFDTFQTEFGLSVTPINSSQIADSLRSGKLVMVSLIAFPTPANDVGHISVIRKVDESGNYYFADPYAGAWTGETEGGASRMPFSLADISSINKGLWAIGVK